MLSYQFYKTLHLIGIFMVVISLGAIGLYAVNGGKKAAFVHRKWLAMTHGIGLLIVIIAGFGLLARLGMMAHLPLWAMLKMVIWLILGALPAVFYRVDKPGKGYWFSIILLASFAAYLAIYKPFMADASNGAPIGNEAPAAVEGTSKTLVPSAMPPTERPPFGTDAK